MLNTIKPAVRRPTTSNKPFTDAELVARQEGQEWLQLAIDCRDNHEFEMAGACCHEGLKETFGVSRPLVVRDQLHDLLESLSCRLATKLEPNSSTPL
jgi:hypothetical protein